MFQKRMSCVGLGIYQNMKWMLGKKMKCWHIFWEEGEAGRKVLKLLSVWIECGLRNITGSPAKNQLFFQWSMINLAIVTKEKETFSFTHKTCRHWAPGHSYCGMQFEVHTHKPLKRAKFHHFSNNIDCLRETIYTCKVLRFAMLRSSKGNVPISPKIAPQVDIWRPPIPQLSM